MADGPDQDSDGSSVANRFTAIEAVASAAKVLFRWAGLALIAYFAFRAIDTLAGDTTVADLGLSVRAFASVKIANLTAMLFGATGVMYGGMQRKLRRDTVERLQGRIKALEQIVDPSRTTSLLTPRGETRPEDDV